VRVADNDDDPVSLLLAIFQATAHQSRADALLPTVTTLCRRRAISAKGEGRGWP
jgi:hypothetical protein